MWGHAFGVSNQSTMLDIAKRCPYIKITEFDTFKI